MRNLYEKFGENKSVYETIILKRIQSIIVLEHKLCVHSKYMKSIKWEAVPIFIIGKQVDTVCMYTAKTVLEVYDTITETWAQSNTYITEKKYMAQFPLQVVAEVAYIMEK